MEWLQGCKDQAMIGCSSWGKIIRTIEEDLAKRVKPQLSDISRREALIELLGPQFTEKHISNEPGDSFSASATKSIDKKEKLVQEMKNWLKNETDGILQEKGLKEKDGHFSGDALSFMNESGNIVSKDIQKQFHQRQAIKRRSLNIGSEDFQNSSEIIGNALTSFIQDSPELVTDMMSSLKNRMMIFPSTLRPHVWKEYLVKRETQEKKGKGSCQQLRDSFQKSLTTSMKEMKVSRITRSLIWKQIDKEVLEVFNRRFGPKAENNEEGLTETTQVLNVLHVYNKSFYSHYIHWASMIQQVFLQNNEFDKDDELITAAMYLELTLRYFAPNQNVAAEVASNVWKYVGDNNKQLHLHITECMKKALSFEKEFLFSQPEESLKLETDFAKFVVGETCVPPFGLVFDFRICAIIVLRMISCLLAEYLLVKCHYYGQIQHEYAVILCVWKTLPLKEILQKLHFQSPPNSKTSEDERTPAVQNIMISQDFTPEIFNVDMDKAEKLINNSEEGDFTEEQRKVIEDPKIFFRKWLIEGFVSVLKPIAAFFVWDQLFLNSWNQSSLQHTCLVLLGLLQPWFFSARDYPTVREVFVKEPYKIYTTDLRIAWKHLLHNGKLKDLSKMNRNVNTTEVPKPSPPVPVPQTEDISDAWLPHKQQTSNSNIKIPHATDTFDFYIDSIRFTSDNCSIVKVTGKFLNLYLSQKPPKVPEIIAYPEVMSPARCPEFKYKLIINMERQVMNPDALILLRAYTVERYIHETVVIGSCLVSIFNNVIGKPVELDVGGRQIRLRRGLPNPDLDIDSLEASHMDGNPIVPCATILIRLLPHDEAELPAPSYQSKYFRSNLSTPNESEKRVYKHYIEENEYKLKMKDMVMMLDKTSSVSDKSASDFIKKKLSQKKSSEALDLPFERFIKYDRKHGLMVVADKAFGLPVYLEGRFFQCLLQLFPGQQAETAGEKIHNFLTQKQDLTCVQRAPDWLDSPWTLKPLCDDHTVLVISLYGIRPTYIPSDGDKESYLIHRGGSELTFSLQHSVAWSVVQCFANNGCLSGIHHIPLFKGQISKSIIDQLKHSSVEDVIKKNLKQVRLLESASMEVTLWDGRFTTKECPPLPVIKSYLKIIPNSQRYIKIKSLRGGPPVQQLLLESLPSSVQRNKEEFEQHKTKFETLIKNSFNSLMNKALTDAGYSPLE